MSQTQVDGFLSRARRRARWTELVPVAREIALLFAILAVSAWIVWPGAVIGIVGLGLLVILLGTAWAARHGRFDVMALDVALGLDGWLASYAGSLDVPAGAADPTMRAWLAVRLASRIPNLPERDLARHLARWRRRPQRLLIVVLLILLLLRMIWLPALPAGVLPLGSGRTPELSSRGVADGAGPTAAGEQSRPTSAESDPDPGSVDPNVPENASQSQPDGGGGAPPPSAPPPSPPSSFPLPLPSRDAFLPMAMIEPTGQTPADSSSVPVPNPPPAPDPPPKSSAGDHAESAPRLDRPLPTSPRDYERARERAMRSGRISDRERHGVAAWFDALLERRH